MAQGFIEAVKEMHAKLERMGGPQAPAKPPPNNSADTVKMLKRFPQLTMPKTGK